MFGKTQDKYSSGSLPDLKFYILIKTTNLTENVLKLRVRNVSPACVYIEDVFLGRCWALAVPKARSASLC